MNKILSGGWYCDVRPDGSYVVLVPNSHLETNRGTVSLPNGQNLLYVDLAPDGVRFAGVGNADDHCWEWTGNQWVDHGIAIGPRAVIYDNNGVLHIVNRVGTATGSQGWRYVDDAGTPVPSDLTYADPARRVWEYTTHAGITIGQGGDGPLGGDPAIVLIDGQRRLLSPGQCRFLKFPLQGQDASIAFVREDSRVAVMLTTTLDQLRALPLANDAAPAPQPKPDPIPEPPKPTPMAIPNHLDTLNAVRAKYPELVDRDQAVAILNEVAWIHRAEGFGLLAKPGGNHGYQPRTGIACSIDWLVHRPSGMGFDAGVDGPDEAHKGPLRPTWGSGENFDLSRFIAPVEPLGQPQDAPKDDAPAATPGEPSAPVSVDVQPLLDKIEDATERMVKAVTDASQAEIAKLDEMKVAIIKSTQELKDGLEKILPLLVGGGAGAGILGGIFGKKK